jgi:hypothetical protein
VIFGISGKNQRVRRRIPTVRVKPLSKKQKRLEATDHFGEVGHLFQLRRAAQRVRFAITEPFLDDRLATDGHGPYVGWHVVERKNACDMVACGGGNHFDELTGIGHFGSDLPNS